MLAKLVLWFVNSAWAKKHAAIVGGFAAGMLFQATYWRQMNETLTVWGVPPGKWKAALAAVAAVAGIGISVAGTMVKGRMDRTQAANGQSNVPGA